MAKDTKASAGIPLNPAGMNDNIPLEPEANFYLTRGLHSLHDKSLQRCNGKLLYQKFADPVLAIHGSLKDIIFVETTGAIYAFTNLSDPLPGIILGDDSEPVLGDDDLPITE